MSAGERVRCPHCLSTALACFLQPGGCCMSCNAHGEHVAAARAWNEGFTACANQHNIQRVDPTHPIERLNPYVPAVRGDTCSACGESGYADPSECSFCGDAR